MSTMHQPTQFFWLQRWQPTWASNQVVGPVVTRTVCWNGEPHNQTISTIDQATKDVPAYTAPIMFHQLPRDSQQLQQVQTRSSELRSPLSKVLPTHERYYWWGCPNNYSLQGMLQSKLTSQWHYIHFSIAINHDFVWFAFYSIVIYHNSTVPNNRLLRLRRYLTMQPHIQ